MNVAVEAHVAVGSGIHVEQDVEIHKEDLGARVVMDIVCSEAQCAQVGISWRHTIIYKYKQINKCFSSSFG